ncbi:outer membrane lipoprotein-sorting protein [Fibrella aquatica]|jgi:Outer membrane lipoprotein-sorting protein|uniref:outer membrane lipoprotein-sorting protein n=1 Tax=Fibrella aquatica TaxID=3242487 RepID=UPI003520CA2A
MKTNKFLAATLAVFVTFGAYAQTVDEIVDKHVTALGGAEKLSGVKTVVTERALSVNNMEIPSVTTIMVGKAMRSEMTIMGNSMIQAVNGNSGWMIRPAMMGGTGDPEDMPAEMLQQSMSQLQPFGSLVDYKANGTKVELVGKEQVDKKDVYHLKVTTKDGQSIDEYIDAATYLVTKVKASANGQENEILFSDYKEVSGVKFPNTMEIVGGQMGPISFITNKVVVNGPVDEAIFKKPTK